MDSGLISSFWLFLAFFEDLLQHLGEKVLLWRAELLKRVPSVGGRGTHYYGTTWNTQCGEHMHMAQSHGTSMKVGMFL